MLTSIGCVGTFSLLVRMTFPFASDSKPDNKSTVFFVFLGVCGIAQLNFSTESHAFHNGGGINLFLKDRDTDLLSVMMMIGFDVVRKNCSNSSNSKHIAKLSLAELYFFICERVNVLEPYATGAKVSRVDVSFLVRFRQYCISCHLETCISH